VWLYHARRRSRPDALPVTLDESDAKVRFESTQVLGDGGLADVASLGGAAHPALVQDGEEQLEAVHREAGLDHRINPIGDINNSYWSYGATCASLGQPLVCAPSAQGDPHEAPRDAHRRRRRVRCRF